MWRWGQRLFEGVTLLQIEVSLHSAVLQGGERDQGCQNGKQRQTQSATLPDTVMSAGSFNIAHLTVCFNAHILS